MSTEFKTKDIINAFPNDNLPIISIGSGMCKREKEISEKRKIICVDPTTEDEDPWFPIKKVMDPDYKNIRELIKEYPEIIGNCHVLIEYPMTDYVTYDFLAIYDLQPLHVVILTTTTSQSGGLLLHCWLNNNNISTTNKKRTREQDAFYLDPNVLKYDLSIKKKIRKGDMESVFITGYNKENEIKKRSLLSPSNMEYMAQTSIDLGNVNPPLKTIHLIQILNNNSTF